MKTGPRILVVDDEPSLISLYALVLRQANYAVCTATTGAEGLACARQERPDIVLLDVMLPDISGLEVCRQLKQDAALPDLFVALCSGLSTSSAHKVDGLDCGADDYLVKPVSPEELLARIRVMIRLRETTAALRASEQHYRRLVEILPDAVALVDQSGQVRAVNSQALALLGAATETELLQRTVFDLTWPTDHERVRASLGQTRSGYFPRHFEITLRKQNGSAVPVELSVTATSAGDGAPAGFLMVARDASERRRAEARRAAFSRLAKQLSAASTPREAAQIIVAVADEVLGWDCCHVRLFSARENQLVPVLAFDEINGQRKEVPAASFSREATPITRYVMEHGARLVNDDDQNQELLALLTPFGVVEQRCRSRLFAPLRKADLQLGIISIQSYRPHAYCAEDLELFEALADHCVGALERISFAESLQESEGRFRSLFESAPLGLALHDARGHFLTINRAYQEMLGYSEAELLRQGVKGITVPEDIAAGQQLFEELRSGGRNYYRREKRYLHRDGRIVWAESSASAVRDAAGSLRFIVSMVTDITARKQAEAEILRLNETLEHRVAERTRALEIANAELWESEQQLRLVLEASSAGTWSWEVASNRATWDRRYHELYGFGPDDPISFEVWISRVHAEDRPRLLARIELIRQTKARDFWNEEFRIWHPVLGERWMADMGRAIRDTAGQLRRLVGINLDITNRKRAEEALRESNERLEERVRERTTALEAANAALRTSEARFRQLAENIDEVFWMSDPAKEQVLYVSPAYERVWGRSCESLVATPQSWLEAVHPEDRERVAAAARHRQASGDYDEQYRIIHTDGSTRWIRDRAYPVADEQGQVYRLVGVAEDITRRKETEAAWRESEARKSAIMQAALDAIITLDCNGKILEFNAAAEKMFGYNRARLLGREFSKTILTPTLRVWFDRGLACDFDGSAGPVLESQMEMKARRAGGLEFPIEFTITRLEVNGRPLFTAFIRDLTEQRRAEEQIRLLADAVESTRELVSVTDAENRFTFVNQAFRDAYGYKDPEILGQTPELLYAPANPLGLCGEVFRQTLAGGWHGEIINRRKDGTEFPISLSTSMIKSQTGETVGLVGVARDISERKRAEKQNMAFALLGHRLSGTTSVEAAADTIIGVASVLFNWDAGYVHLVSSDQQHTIPVLTIDTINGQRQRVVSNRPRKAPSPLMQSVLKDGARLINRPQDSSPAQEMYRFGDVQRPSASLMFVPIHSGQTTVGILSIQSYRHYEYSPRDLHLLQILADHCGDALRRIEVTEALQRAEAKYRGIFENATEGISQTTPDGQYLSANPAQARMLGYESPEALVASVSNIEAQTYVLPAQRQELKRLLETERTVRGFEVERVRRDGRRIWVSVNGHAVRNAAGEVVWYECTCQDITERKLAEQELRRLSHLLIDAQEVERQRVARELHDGVNQLIASVKMRLNKVNQRGANFGPAVQEILNRCETLLVQALEENRRIAHNLHPTDLDHLGLGETCRNFCREFAAHTGLATHCRVTGFTQRLAPHLERNLFRILQEATNNIQKHARAKTVHIALTLRDQTVALKIRDDGRGFDPEKGRRRQKRHAGAGLTNIRERAAAMGGTCELMSAPKQGTTILVRVPAVEWQES